jgi:hypothetical protein
MDERSVPRTVADLSVPALLHGRTIRIQIYNLSSRGCMFETVAPVEDNEPIQIMLVDDVTAQGHVIWSQKSFAGVQFLRPLHAAVIQHLGFQEPINEIDLWTPEDRFGRRLPPSSGKSSTTVH